MSIWQWKVFFLQAVTPPVPVLPSAEWWKKRYCDGKEWSVLWQHAPLAVNIPLSNIPLYQYFQKVLWCDGIKRLLLWQQAPLVANTNLLSVSLIWTFIEQ